MRAGDGYHAWTHAGYVSTGSVDWVEDWNTRATGRSLGAEVRLEDQRFRLVVGARVVLRHDGQVEIADGRIGSVSAGLVRLEAALRAEARLIAAPEWASRWFSGAPYLWGGRTEWGVDCSGLVQATYAARGVALPRDSDQQSLAGREVPIHVAGAGYEAGDVLCFADGRRVSHVALWAGAGRIVHSALSAAEVLSAEVFNGWKTLTGLEIMEGLGSTEALHIYLSNTPAAKRLRDFLVAVRRVGPSDSRR